jgi:hypothetical protein
MFPITKAALSFLEISDYWSREIHPPASPKELLHVLEAAWWSGELRGNSFHSPLQLLKKMFVSMRDQNDLGIIFIVGDDEGPPPIELPDGCVKVDIRQRIPVPSDDPDSWKESACGQAFGALAECSSHAFPHLAVDLPWIELSYEEFTDWLAKRGYAKPMFWRLPETNDVDRGPGAHQHRNGWKAKLSAKLSSSEQAVMHAMNELWPDGKVVHRAKVRDHLISQKTNVSPRTIQRALTKIRFV